MLSNLIRGLTNSLITATLAAYLNRYTHHLFPTQTPAKLLSCRCLPDLPTYSIQ
jgi:hypothetical protein